MSNMKALEEYQRKVRLGEIERTKALNPIEKLKTKPKSLRFAINAKCYDCVCGQRHEIKYCTALDCPLFNVRPYQDK